MASPSISELEGRTLEAVEGSAAPYWVFRFGRTTFVGVECDWRIVADDRVALARGDHQQMFGREEPLDAVREAELLLKGRRVTAASLSEVGDLSLAFEGGARLQTFTASSGHESCTIRLDDSRELIIMGGGGVHEV